jgi:hypothetical protein
VSGRPLEWPSPRAAPADKPPSKTAWLHLRDDRPDIAAAGSAAHLWNVTARAKPACTVGTPNETQATSAVENAEPIILCWTVISSSDCFLD